jgi:hypothetical protein
MYDNEEYGVPSPNKSDGHAVAAGANSGDGGAKSPSNGKGSEDELSAEDSENDDADEDDVDEDDADEDDADEDDVAAAAEEEVDSMAFFSMSEQPDFDGTQFKFVDMDVDSTIDWEEARSQGMPLELFKAIDLTGEGTITMEQFSDALARGVSVGADDASDGSWREGRGSSGGGGGGEAASRPVPVARTFLPDIDQTSDEPSPAAQTAQPTVPMPPPTPTPTAHGSRVSPQSQEYDSSILQKTKSVTTAAPERRQQQSASDLGLDLDPDPRVAAVELRMQQTSAQLAAAIADGDAIVVKQLRMLMYADIKITSRLKM